MELVTGKAGTDHISAADLAAMYRGLLIADDCVLEEGDKLSCTMLDANTAEIGTGSCMLQAHHARIDVAEQVTIESGSPGYNRNDLIVARYTLGTGNIQGVYLAVIKGTATLGDATDPTYTEGDIDGGDVLVEFPLWRIPLTGITVGDPERIMPTIDTLQAQITSVRESVPQVLWSGTQAAGAGLSLDVPGINNSSIIIIDISGGPAPTVIIASNYQNSSVFYGGSNAMTSSSLTTLTIEIVHSGDTVTSIGIRSQDSSTRSIKRITKLL